MIGTTSTLKYMSNTCYQELRNFKPIECLNNELRTFGSVVEHWALTGEVVSSTNTQGFKITE